MIIALVPAYNSVHTIAEVVLKSKEVVTAVVVFDDGSTDDTAFVAEGCGAEVIREERNRGKGYALMRLFEHAKKFSPKVVVTIDSDMQHNPRDIQRLIQPILVNEADVTVGIRQNISYVRRIGNNVLDLMSGLKKKESQSGFRAYSVKALRQIKITTNGFGVDTEILGCVEGMRIKELLIDTRYDKYSHKRNFVSHFVEVFNFIFLRRPLLNLGVLGGSGFLLGLFGMAEIVRVWNLKNELALGTLLFFMIILLLGAFTFFVGIILHVIGREKK